MLPANLHRFFWDVCPADVDIQPHAAYIIERLMEAGDVEAVKWMLATYPREKMILTLKTTRSLTPKSAHFWAFYFNLNPTEVSCIRKS
jgi:hypothetical protein